MTKRLLFTLLALSYNATAQTDSVKISASSIPDSLLKAPSDSLAKVKCTDTIRLGNFYFSGALGTRVSFEELNNAGNEDYLATWGSNYGFFAGYRTLNDRFLFETGYLIRELNNVNKLSFYYGNLDLIISSELKEIPVYIKTRVLNKASGKLKVRAITGLNFTWVNETDYEFAGSFDVIERNGNQMTLKSKKPYYMDEVFILDRNARTSKSNSNLHLTAEIGLEGSYKLTNSVETGAAISYQYTQGPLERLNVDFIGNERFSKTRHSFNAPDPSLNMAFYLRYNFGNITYLKCRKPKQ